MYILGRKQCTVELKRGTIPSEARNAGDRKELQMADTATAAKNPMKTAKVDFTVKGIDDKAVKEYFEGKKVKVTKKGAGWIAEYTARGAAKNDIKKRLDVMTRDNGSYTITGFETKNLEPKK
jgi:glucose/arabinose dehydrogenase